jgi:hypothetical protein
MKYVHEFLDGLGTLFDKLAGVAPGDLQAEISFLVLTLASLGILHVANATNFANAVYAVVIAILALGVAVKGIFSAYVTAKLKTQNTTKPAA